MCRRYREHEETLPKKTHQDLSVCVCVFATSIVFKGCIFILYSWAFQSISLKIRNGSNASLSVWDSEKRWEFVGKVPTILVYIYLSVPGKRPWALTAQTPKIRGGRRRCLTIPVQAPTPDLKLTDRRYWIDLHRCFTRASFFRQARPVRQYRKLYPARKRTKPKSPCHGFAAFVTCSTRISYCKRRTLRMRLCANVAAGCSGAWNSLMSSNCELSSHHARTLHGGRLHREPWKTTELSKSRGGRLRENGRLPRTIRYVYNSTINTFTVCRYHWNYHNAFAMSTTIVITLLWYLWLSNFWFFTHRETLLCMWTRMEPWRICFRRLQMRYMSSPH